jgi:hypothetical protein
MTRTPETLALVSGDIVFEVDPAAGGRVTSFRLAGREALLAPDVDENNYGSTLWTSPQSDWGWPPPPEFDQVAYAATRAEETITLVGPSVTTLRVRLEKRFSLDRPRGAIEIEYSLHNPSETARTYAPWEVSRVPLGGLTFFPTGERSLGPLPVVQRGGMTWYAHAPQSLDDTGQKHSADGREGYIAHAGGGLLFVKTFLDLPPERQAPGEGEVEVYGNNRYVEVEAQGPYAPIAPGGLARWRVRWYLRALAENDVGIENGVMMAKLREILGQDRA